MAVNGEFMTLIWPWMLLLLFIIPVVVGLYWWLDRRRRSLAARFSSG